MVMRYFVVFFFAALLPEMLIAQQSSPIFFDTWTPKNADIPPHQSLSSPDDSVEATITIQAEDTLAKVSPYIYGNNINPYIGQIHQQQKLVDYVKQLSPNVLRLPGGNLSNVYFWDASADNMPPGVPDSTYMSDDNEWVKQPIDSWYGKPEASNAWMLSTDGFYDFIEQTGATPIISVNYSYARYGTSDDPVAQAAHYAAEWVRYDSGRTKYWEIGNENYGEWQTGYIIDTTQNKDGQPRRINGEVYGEHALVFMDSMRAAAAEIGSEIYIGVQTFVKERPGWASSVEQEWNERMFGVIGDAADFFIQHDYFTDYNEDSPPYHIFNSVNRQFGEVTDYYPQKISSFGVEPKPIALTEWNIFAVGSRQQVSNVSGMHATMVLGELASRPEYGMGNRWNVGNSYSGGDDHGMFKVESQNESPAGVPRWNPRPDYFHMYYFQRMFGDHSVSSTSGNTNIISYASRFASGETGVVIVNRGTNKKVVELDFDSLRAAGTYYYYSLVGGDDNSPYSGQVWVNGTEPDYDRGGPIDSLTNIKAWSASAEHGVRFTSPPRSVQYMIVDSLAVDTTSSDTSTTNISEPIDRPATFTLGQNYPNPFNPSTQINYSLKSGTHVSIQIYNAIGQRVATLVDRRQTPGTYTVSWNGTGSQGRLLSSGVYIYRMKAGDFVQSRKMILLK